MLAHLMLLYVMLAYLTLSNACSFNAICSYNACLISFVYFALDLCTHYLFNALFLDYLHSYFSHLLPRRGSTRVTNVINQVALLTALGGQFY